MPVVPEPPGHKTLTHDHQPPTTNHDHQPMINDKTLWRQLFVFVTRLRTLTILSALMLCLLCSCRRHAPPPLSSLTLWQSQWQAVALPADIVSDGMKLCLPPVPVYYAALVGNEQTRPLILIPDDESLSILLSQYCQAWNQVLAHKLPSQIELPDVFSLPPAAWCSSISIEDFQQSGVFLYRALKQEDLSAEEKERLQLLLLYHEQQLELLKTLHFMDRLNRGKETELVAALKQFRAYASFRHKFAERLTAAFMPELLAANQVVDDFLRPWISLPELQNPLRSLPPLWMSLAADEEQPDLGEKLTLTEWSARQPLARRYATVREELQERKHDLETGHQGFTWMVLGFDRPEKSDDTQLYIFALPLSEESEFYLNGKRLYSENKQACLLPLPDAEAGEEQLLVMKLPNASLNSQLWAPWLIAVKKAADSD